MAGPARSLISSIIEPGQKIEFQSVRMEEGELSNGEKRVYRSAVFDVISEDSIEIMMPTEGTKMILLPVGRVYAMVFFVGKNLYSCDAEVVDRYKRDNAVLLAMKIISNLRRFQRREYYRFSCSLTMNSRNLEEEEIRAFEENKSILIPELPLKQGIILDISGGGLRFLATQAYDVGSLIYCTYILNSKTLNKEYNLVGEVLESKEMPEKPGVFEHRVRFTNIKESERDEIIRYIFDEERKIRRKEMGEDRN